MFQLRIVLMVLEYMVDYFCIQNAPMDNEFDIQDHIAIVESLDIEIWDGLNANL